MLFVSRDFPALRVLAAVIAMTVVPPSANAQSSGQAVTIVVAAAPGGFADGVARIIGERISAKLGQPVVVENKGGAGGNLAARAVLQSQPDGNTILVSTTSMAINGALYKNMGYKTSDITPVAIVGSAPESVVVHPSNPAKNLKEFIEAARGKPIEYATAGVGSGSHIAAEYVFKVLGKAQTIHVPYPGGAPAITAVLGNHVGAMAVTVSPVIGHINSGKLRGLGIASERRNPLVADVPTYEENGFTGFAAASWVGFFVPSTTDTARLIKLNSAINDALKEDAVQDRLKRFGLAPRFGNPAETMSYFKGEVDHWGKMVRTLDLSIN